MKIYLQFISFLHTDMAQVVEILPHVSKTAIYLFCNMMGADVLVTQKAKPSATHGIVYVELVWFGPPTH